MPNNKAFTSCASQSKLPYHPSNASEKMPWWSKALWELRDKMRSAYKRKLSNKSSCLLGIEGRVPENDPFF